MIGECAIIFALVVLLLLLFKCFFNWLFDDSNQ